MSITTITTDVTLAAQFRAVDERGDAVSITNSQGAMNTLTPLAAMEMFEHLHGARNKVRREAGLAEIPTPDEGLLALGFLKGVKELYERGETPNLVDLRNFFGALVEQCQIARLEEAVAGSLALQHVRCPACKVRPKAADFAITEEPDGIYSTCKACGLTHLTYLWDAEGLWKPSPRDSAVPQQNGQEPAEV